MALDPEQKRLRYERDDVAERDGMRVAGGETGPRMLAALLRIEDRIIALERRMGAVEVGTLETVTAEPDPALAEMVRLLRVIAGEPAEEPAKRGPGRPRKEA
jgi:hypothetical protein